MSSSPPTAVNTPPLTDEDMDFDDGRGRYSGEDVTFHGLRIPRFAHGMTTPATLNEPLSVWRKPRPSGSLGHPTDAVRETSGDPPPVEKSRQGIIANISRYFTEASLKKFAGPDLSLIFPKIKILSMNDNCKGKFGGGVSPEDPHVVTSFAVFTRLSPRAPEFMLAYGQKSHFVYTDLEWEFVSQIYKHFATRLWAPHIITAQQASAPAESKFGGGLGRRSSASQPARFGIRGKSNSLKKLGDDDFKRLGVSATEEIGEFTVLRFSRIEQRDFACDSFIVGLGVGESTKDGFTISSIRLPDGTDAVVVLENFSGDAPIAAVPQVIDFEGFFQKTRYPNIVASPPGRY